MGGRGYTIYRVGNKYTINRVGCRCFGVCFVEVHDLFFCSNSFRTNFRTHCQPTIHVDHFYVKCLLNNALKFLPRPDESSSFKILAGPLTILWHGPVNHWERIRIKREISGTNLRSFRGAPAKLPGLFWDMSTWVIHLTLRRADEG